MHPTDRYARAPEIRRLKKVAVRLRDLQLSRRQVADVELLLDGGYAPLDGFMDGTACAAVLREARLPSGDFWPVPVVLSAPPDLAATLKADERLALRDAEGVLLAVMTVRDVFAPDFAAESARFGAPLHERDCVLLGGPLIGVQPPPRQDFRLLRPAPAELAKRHAQLGHTRIIGVQARDFLHGREFLQSLRAAERLSAGLLIHPPAGARALDDPAWYARVRALEALLREYPPGLASLALCPLYPRGGLPDLLLQAMVQRNCGCTHFMVLPADAATRKLSARLADDFPGLPLTPVVGERMVWPAGAPPQAEDARTGEVEEAGEAEEAADADFRLAIAEGREPPPGYSFPAVLDEYRTSLEAGPGANRGVTVFFTGLSGSGKSTIANLLLVRILEAGAGPVTLLDGDLVRRHLSRELGFSRADRDANILRIGYVASEITRHGGIAICAPIAPYAATRRRVRELVGKRGGFLEVHVNTPLAECERRDRKGLYARARLGLLRNFTGVSDPYETPENPELVLDTLTLSAEEAALLVLRRLQEAGYVAGV